MTFPGPIIVGATPDDQINYGETIDLELTYQDEAGNPTDLSSSAVSVFSSTPAVIKTAAVVTITNPIQGKVRFLLNRTDALALRCGNSARFRLQMIFGPDSDDVTPDIYLQVT